MNLSLLLLVMAASPAAAEADPMAAFYGNRLVIQAGPYWSAERRHAPDHTYRDQVVDDGYDRDVSGTWTLEDGKVCITQVKPEPDRRYCNLGPGHKLGDAWTDRDPYTGNEVRFRLEPQE